LSGANVPHAPGDVAQMNREKAINGQQLHINQAAQEEQQPIILRRFDSYRLKIFAQRKSSKWLVLKSFAFYNENATVQPLHLFHNSMNLKSILQQSRILRFLLAGGINTLFGFAVYTVLIVSGAVVWVAVLVGMLAGTAFNFLTTGGYVFRDLSLHRFPLFLFFYFTVFAINLVLIECLSSFITNKILLQALISPLLAIISYLLMSRCVFQSTKR
jgi:putative flippase GtrA